MTTDQAPSNAHQVVQEMLDRANRGEEITQADIDKITDAVNDHLDKSLDVLNQLRATRGAPPLTQEDVDRQAAHEHLHGVHDRDPFPWESQ